MSYCTQTDLIDRLSNTGLIYVADDDGDETVSPTELGASLDRAIAAATAEIDAALQPHVSLPLADQIAWLTQRAIDLAAEHLAERRGGDVPMSLAKAAARSRGWLEQVRAGDLRVPGLDYPADKTSLRHPDLGLPRVSNPSNGDGG